MRLKVPALVMVSLFRSKQGHRYAAAGAVAAGGKQIFFYEISQTLADCAVVS